MQPAIASARRSTLQSTLGRIPTDVRLLLALMGVLVPVRIAHTAQVHSMYTDGGYYLEVARHVRDGQGLTSHLSLYHFGYEYFPHPTSVYPLWPWLLGMAGRLGDLEWLAHWLPLSLSFLAVLAAFLFGRALWPEPVFPAHVPGFHAGHLFALGLALQGDFIFFSSMPYTEPLAFSLLFLLCWRVVQKGASLDWPWAVEIGVWLGLMYLSRFQLLVAPLAMTCAYLVRVVLGPDRLRVALHGAVALGVAGLFVGGWFLHIRTFVLDASLSSLLRFDQNRANDLLHEIDVIVSNRGLLDLLLDRAAGVLVAWDPASDASYAASFYTLHWALAAALPIGAAQLARQLRQHGPTLESVRSAVAPWAFLLLLALGGLLSVHAIHKHFNGAWYFSTRQGMVSLLSFLLALGWLLRQPRPLGRVLGVIVLSSTLVLGSHRLWTQVTDLPRELREDDPYGELLGWLATHAPAEGPLVVAMDSQVQRVAWRTQDVGYHWVNSDTPYADYLTLADRLGVRYIVLKKKALERPWKLTSDPERLERDFVRSADAPSTHVVFERR
jgi:hypothetical protein